MSKMMEEIKGEGDIGECCGDLGRKWRKKERKKICVFKNMDK